MDRIGTNTARLYRTQSLLAKAGEGAIYTILSEPSCLLKIFDNSPSPRTIKKLELLSRWPSKPAFTALPKESVFDPATMSVVGFIQPYFAGALSLSSVLDANGRRQVGIANDLAARVKLCRLLAEAFARVHAAHLVVGDVSAGNFLVSRSWLFRPKLVFVIDTNSFQVTVRSRQGTEVYASGVATEEFAAPEVQPTDWSTSARSVFTDSFGFAVLAWKLLFGGAHPFAVVTPRNVDVPPLGQRIEQRLFPFSPGSPIPADWTPPSTQPSLAILPVALREMFFRAFSAADPRDRPLAEDWSREFQHWEASLNRSLPLRLVAMFLMPLKDSASPLPKRLTAWATRCLVLSSIVCLAIFYPGVQSTPTLPDRHVSYDSPTAAPKRLLSKNPKPKPARVRYVDRDLFPKSLWSPIPTPKEKR